MRVVVNPGEDDQRVIASDVDIADSFLSQTVGLMGKSSLPDDYALVFEFGDPPLLYRLLGSRPRRFIHMLFVRTPLDVVWVDDGEVVQVKRLRPWTGIGVAKSDCVIELPAGAAEGVSAGDTIIVTDDEPDAGAGSGDTNPVAEAIDEAADQAASTDDAE